MTKARLSFIKNQPFTSYYDKTVNRTIDLHYQVRTRDYASGDWETIELYDQNLYGYWCREPYKVQNYSAEYTMLVIQSGAKQEFQVQASIGYVTKQNDHILDLYDALTTFGFVGVSSDWSNTRTNDGTIYTSSPTIKPIEPTITPQQTPQTTPKITPKTTQTAPDIKINLSSVDWQNVALAVMAAAITVIGIAVVMLWRRIPKAKPT
jgi:hypothetical protein